MGLTDISGTMLGQYHLQELLGMGGMGVVYRAHQATLQREVAIKILPAALALQTGYLERFQREAQTAAGLEHAHIVPILDYGNDQGVTFVVMRLLKGGSLASYMSHARRQPSLASVGTLLQQLGGALDYAHSRGVIHRDLKPSNIMFDEAGDPFLVDFGIAKLVGTLSGITDPGTMVGTPAYMAPEQWQSSEAVPATDQYALAVVAYTVLTGQLPFAADTPHAYMFQHITKRPPSARDFRDDMPLEAADVLAIALAKRPEDRFSSVRAFAEAYNAAIRGHAWGPALDFAKTDILPRPNLHDELATGITPTPARSTRRWQWRAALSVLALLLVMGVVTLARVGNGSHSRTTTPATTEVDPALVLYASASATLDLTTAQVQATIDREIGSLQTRAAATEGAIQSATAAIPQTIDAGTAARLTQTATLWTPTLTPDLLQTAAYYTSATAIVRATQLERGKTQTATLWTMTPTPSMTPTATRVPNVQRVDGVEMVEVPAGCFMMGSENGGRDELPVQEICFAEPFWIDRTEITNAQFAALGGQAARESRWTEPDRPRVSITWFEAASFCVLRGARLPTEAEWEYAARGPYGLRYPWGNSFDAERVIYNGNSQARTWDVGTKPSGVSWIGAYDMAGNAWEWTESLYLRYPFDATMSAASTSDETSYRSIRGGSWTSDATAIRTAGRGGYLPSNQGGDIGFRCVRDSIPNLPPSTPTPDPDTLHNADWTPVVETFEGIEMVLVPMGCYRMGSQTVSAEQPVHEQCLSADFWIDRTEVTNAQFEATGGVAANPSTNPAPSAPRDSLTWVEARDYCALRGARLPTEAEWEYAARGPDGWAYPWGEDFEAARVVFADTADGQVAAVGSLPNGAAWIGALDMAGNVWEWTSSQYQTYPYHATDGRENALDTTTFRTLRGGAWTTAAGAVRSTNRVGRLPLNAGADIGVRCVRTR